ncbi:MAG: carbon-phosphorus lyase, partial [Chloroflexota bacterium]
MEMIICGTAAAEGVPALFCQCPVCRQARVLGGRELRTRSAYQLGEQVRIDFGPDAHHHALCYELDYRPLRHLLLTHAHWDHWVPHELHWRSPGFSQVPEDAVLHVYGNELARQRLHEELPVDPARCRIAFHLLEPWQPIELPEAGLTLVPVLADHARDQDCYNFLIGHGDAWALQGNDTGWYPQETWDFLRSYRLDVALFDSTCGRLESWRNHLGCEGVV